MKEYITIEVGIGRNLKESLDNYLKEMASKGWSYKGSIPNEAMDTIIIIFEKG
jgi:hypothetical protein